MITDKMTGALNKQLNLELYSANLYLQMSAWCECNSFEGAASFLKAHSREEMQHMHRFFDYLTDIGTMPLLASIEAPPTSFSSLNQILAQAYDHEKKITISIHELAHLSITSADYSTFNFLQWFVAEQCEEEKLFKFFLDKLNLVGNSGQSLFFIDKEMAKHSGNSFCKCSNCKCSCCQTVP